MTNEEILTKAIEKAVKNGWAGGYFNDVEDTVDELLRGDGLLKHIMTYSIIFSHDFAKAFWGTRAYCPHDPMVTHDCDPKNEVWEYQLQQMVLEENPIKYLEQYL